MKKMYLETEVVALDGFEPGMCGSMCGFWDNTKCLCKIGFDGPVCPLKELPESHSDSAINDLINGACEGLRKELKKIQEQLECVSKDRVPDRENKATCGDTVENFLSKENPVEEISEKAEQGEHDPNSPWFAAGTPEERRKRRKARIKELGLEKYDEVPIREPGLERPSYFFNTKAEFLERVYAMREQAAKDAAKDKEREEKTDGSN